MTAYTVEATDYVKTVIETVNVETQIIYAGNDLEQALKCANECISGSAGKRNYGTRGEVILTSWEEGKQVSVYDRVHGSWGHKSGAQIPDLHSKGKGQEPEQGEKFVYPRYVVFAGSNHCALYHSGGGEYYRPAGAWGTQTSIKGRKIYVDNVLHPQMHGKELIETTGEFFRKDNEGYL
jgi:hypothetical protein